MSVYELAYDFTEKTNHSLFITGKAGTGKTTFLHNLRKNTHKQMAVVAPTGVAAINAGGVTIHSFFQLPFTPFIPTLEGEASFISKLKMNTARRNVIRELELLVIDEVSMVRADVLDAIDAVLRNVRHKRQEPFGGVQMVFIGDMFQLSPVAKSDEWDMLSNFYNGVYFFNSKVLQRQEPIYIEFDKIFRQTDGDFINLLNQVREDTLTDDGMKLLQSRFNPNFRPHSDDFHITLTTHNAIADKINTEELAKLNSKTKSFKADVKGQFYESSYPSDETLELKKGARVMFVKNDTEQPRKFFNGKIGTVNMFDEENEIIYVQPADPEEEVIAVGKMSWENVKYSTNETTLQIEEEVIGTFTQYPLRLAWAITIHKSQGLTFDKAVIDAGASFAPGQVYVALSRCRTLEGITLLSQINKFSIRNDAQVVEYSSRASNENILLNQFDQAQQKYFADLLLSLFDFASILYSSKIWHRDILEIESSFNEGTTEFIRMIISIISDIENVAEKFQNQLRNVFYQTPIDESYLDERIKAASVFFDEKLSVLIEALYESQATTDSRTNAKVYDDGLNEIFASISQKRHIINGIAMDVGVDKFFELRKSFALSNFNLSSFSGASANKKKLKSEHPELLSQLIKQRNRFAEELNMPVYVVANSNALVEMSNYLPHDKNSLLRISGVGPKSYERFGEKFLEIINSYRNMHGIEISKVLPPEKKKKKSKASKGASAQETLRLYKEGKDIAQIAEERKLVEGTIAGHLAAFVKTKEVDIFKFVTPEQLQKAKTTIENKPEELSNYAALKEYFSPIEINFINEYFRKED